MSGEIRYYRGQYKVKVLTQSEGYWIIEALEDFEDAINGQKNKVKVGEQRIISPNLAFKEKNYPQSPKEHSYELKMEKKVKQMISKQKKKQTSKKRET